MHWLMKLPELFAALGTALTAAVVVLTSGKKYILAGVCFFLACACGLAGYVIGVKFDLFSEEGLRRFRWLNVLTMVMLVGVVGALLIA